MVAMSVGLSMAVVSLAKLLLLLCALYTLSNILFRTPYTAVELNNRAIRFTPVVVLTTFFAFALSLLWTTAPAADAMGSLAKYGKLLVIVVLTVLIRDRREALYALGWFVLAQLFLVASSWALFLHLPVPWATSNMALTNYAVFSSYLDQGIMGSVTAALCWHLRDLAPGKYGRQFAVAAAVLLISNVLFVLIGRSGHVVSIVLLSLAIMWQLPKKYRVFVVFLPFLIALTLFFSSNKVRERLVLVKNEVQSYSIQDKPDTSSGIRLHLWLNAVKILAEHPVLGSGVGSWSTEYNRLQNKQNSNHRNISGNGNPHQEYLQWGLQLGVPGILLIFSLFGSIFLDTLFAKTEIARATQSILVALVVACLFNSVIYDALIGDFFCIAIGLLFALSIHSEKQFPIVNKFSFIGRRV